MPLYFFDTRDNESLIEDELGLEYPDLEVVKIEAARALAEFARDKLPGASRRELGIEVRDQSGPVLIAHMSFEAVVLRAS